MAKLPKKVTVSDDARETTLREFVSTAVHRSGTGSLITRVNLSLTEDDLISSELLQNKLGLSRVEVFRAGLLALDIATPEERQTIVEEVRRKSPKSGRPPVKK